ncbi:prenyltransferase/squalene oxidase repeat-containing protein [Streptomyces lateritius]|uniref:prenyltransferase/squalene oxidase repeat-containing protein n=1 Tax=Streptomyces lateritius TaxID=67313 RepID=UPI001678B426|nr:prenyltransferase/squalene oxidase repeat-containing protein [Streptomyces lateritius]GGU14371.1 hypothetical protein GCM10010272_69260 [Streptomyces lateritius]
MRISTVTPVLPAWDRGALPSGLATATARLRDCLTARIGPDGAVHDPCRSRVLESALLLALLERTQSHPAARRRVAGYLSGHRDSVQPLDRLLAQAALAGHPCASKLLDLDEFLAQAPDFTGPRKRALLHAVLHLLGVTLPAGPISAEAFTLQHLHSWARVQVTAVKAVLGHAHRGAAGLTGEDLGLLLFTQQAGRVWEGNLLIHLSVLHALTLIPGQRHVVAEGIRTALEHQRCDGGMPFICDEDTWLTATAGVALHAAGAGPAVNIVARRLLSLQHSDGGWSYTHSARLTDVDCTSVAVEVLHLADPAAHRLPISRAISALQALRGSDGGFPTYLAGAPSEACMTAAAANALSTQRAGRHTAVDSALAHLASQQHADGSFPPDWSSSRLHTVFRAVLAASRQPAPPRSPASHITERAMRLVAEGQNPDGGWGQQAGSPSDALSTSYALITLSTAGSPTPGPAARGAAYLLSRQQPDGSITSIPDSIGPRPFAFTVPALADIFALLALGHLTHRLGTAPAEQNLISPIGAPGELALPG